MAETNGVKAGWSDRELLECLLHVVEISNVTLNYKDNRIRLPPGRNANGFMQKINALKRALKPEWDVIAASHPTNEDTPVKPKATSKKRKSKGENNDNADADGGAKKRGRGRPSKKQAEAEVEANEEAVSISSGIKDEEMDDEERA